MNKYCFYVSPRYFSLCQLLWYNSTVSFNIMICIALEHGFPNVCHEISECVAKFRNLEVHYKKKRYFYRPSCALTSVFDRLVSPVAGAHTPCRTLGFVLLIVKSNTSTKKMVFSVARK